MVKYSWSDNRKYCYKKSLYLFFQRLSVFPSHGSIIDGSLQFQSFSLTDANFFISSYWSHVSSAPTIAKLFFGWKVVSVLPIDLIITGLRSSRVWMRSSREWMGSSREWMRSSRGWMRSSREWMRSSRGWMRSSRGWMRSSRVWMTSSRVRMKSSRVVKTPKSQLSWVQFQHPPTQQNLRGGRLSSVEY